MVKHHHTNLCHLEDKRSIRLKMANSSSNNSQVSTQQCYLKINWQLSSQIKNNSTVETSVVIHNSQFSSSSNIWVSHRWYQCRSSRRSNKHKWAQDRSLLNHFHQWNWVVTSTQLNRIYPLKIRMIQHTRYSSSLCKNSSRWERCKTLKARRTLHRNTCHHKLKTSVSRFMIKILRCITMRWTQATNKCSTMAGNKASCLITNQSHPKHWP